MRISESVDKVTRDISSRTFGQWSHKSLINSSLRLSAPAEFLTVIVWMCLPCLNRYDTRSSVLQEKYCPPRSLILHLSLHNPRRKTAQTVFTVARIARIEAPGNNKRSWATILSNATRWTSLHIAVSRRPISCTSIQYNSKLWTNTSVSSQTRLMMAATSSWPVWTVARFDFISP
jgi:hypothetical protein